MARDTETVTGELLDESAPIGLKQLCEICGIHADYVVEMVEAGIIQPQGDKPTMWLFSAVSVMRSSKALRLRRDLDINLSGLAVTLDLLDRVDALQDELKSLRQQIEKLQA